MTRCSLNQSHGELSAPKKPTVNSVEILSTQHHWQGAMGLVMEGLLELGKGYLLVLLLPSFTHPIGFIVLLCLKREKK